MIVHHKVRTWSLLVSLLSILAIGSSNQLIAQAPALAQSPVHKNLIVAMTTSIEDSGLLDELVPALEKKTGYKLKKVSVGTGQALALAKKGEVDALFVNSPRAEREVLASGAVINRHLVMHNDFVIVGPSGDQAKIHGIKNAVTAFSLIAKKKALFISRDDDSGTNKLEKDLWKRANIQPNGDWYVRTGAGMGQTLQIANQKRGYTLVDRATYIFQGKNISLPILVQGDKQLLNLYHVIEVNPKKFPKVNSAGAKAFIDFVLSPEGQKLIASHGKKQFGKPLFYVDGGKTEKDYGL